MNPYNDISFEQYLEACPLWMKLGTLLSIWAILCVGICLPLITLKLYSSNIAQWFGKESAYSDLDERYPFRTDKQRESGTNLSETAPAKQTTLVTDAKLATAPKQDKDQAVDAMKEFQERKYWPKS